MSEMDEIIHLFHSSYSTRFRFPDWCNGVAYQKLHDKFCKTARLVAPSKKKNEAGLLIYQRQPVNIMMNTTGTDQIAFSKLQKKMGDERWKDSYYTEHYRQRAELAVNVAVYCETPVLDTNPGHDTEASTRKLQTYEQSLPKSFLTIRVLNLIGLGFDNLRQPDYMAFAEIGNPRNPSLEDAKDWLRPRVAGQLQKVEAVLDWAATNKKPIRYMHLPGVGCGYFAGNMPIEAVWSDLSEEAILKWRKAWPDLHVDTDPELYTGGSAGLHTKWRQLDTKHGLQHCLFVNAWDPHSFVGNGNLADNSLDGWYGRYTAMAVLCWPGTNPYLLLDDYFIDSTPVRQYTDTKTGKAKKGRTPGPEKSSAKKPATKLETVKKPTKVKKLTKAKKPTKTPPKKTIKSKKWRDVHDDPRSIQSRKCANFNTEDKCPQKQACTWRPYRPRCTPKCYRMTKKEVLDTPINDDDPRKKKWVQRQKREYLLGRRG